MNDWLDAFYGVNTDRGYTLIAQAGQKRYLL